MAVSCCCSLLKAGCGEISVCRLKSAYIRPRLCSWCCSLRWSSTTTSRRRLRKGCREGLLPFSCYLFALHKGQTDYSVVHASGHTPSLFILLTSPIAYQG